MALDLGGLLQQYLGGAGTAQDTQDHFQQVAQGASPDLLRAGLEAMFRSDRTPAFGQMAGELFGQATAGQQAGMLEQLLRNMGPGVLGSLLGGAGGGGLAGILGQLTQGGSTTSISPDVAANVSPEQVQVIADHAEQHSPGIIEAMSSFYAQHPTLVKTLGSAALSIALAKMAQQHPG